MWLELRAALALALAPHDADPLAAVLPAVVGDDLPEGADRRPCGSSPPPPNGVAVSALWLRFQLWLYTYAYFLAVVMCGLRRWRMTHNNELVGRGTLRVVDDPTFPAHDMFPAGEGVPVPRPARDRALRRRRRAGGAECVDQVRRRGGSRRSTCS